MSHHIYTTDAFVIDSTPVGEANNVYTLFTHDLGLIRASAQGVRLSKSKLKHALQDFSEVRISLVRGKEIWRITSAMLSKNLFTVYRSEKDAVLFFARVLFILKRLVGREEKNEALFTICRESINFLESTFLKPVDIKLVEFITVLKILSNLGYLATVPELQPFVISPLDMNLVELMKRARKIAVQEINRSLRESQL